MQKINKSRLILTILLSVLLVFSAIVLFACDMKSYEIINISLDKQYDGKSVKPKIETANKAPYIIEYRNKNEQNFSKDAPVSAGEYVARITFPENDGYKEKVIEEGFIISQRPVYLSGIIVENKYYDGLQNAKLKGEPFLDNVVDGDDVSLASEITAKYQTSEIGNNIDIIFDEIILNGEDKDNYYVEYPVLKANIFEETEIYTVNYVAQRGGYINGEASQLVSNSGQTSEVTAVAEDGYYFVKWSDGLTNPIRKDTCVSASFTLTAQFAPIVNEKELDLFIIAGQSNSVCYTGKDSADLDVLNDPNYPENVFEYRPNLKNIQKLQNPVGEGVSSAGVSQGYSTGGTWFSSMAKAYIEQTGRSVVILPAGNPGVTTNTYYQGGANFNMLMEKYNSFKSWIDGQENYTLGKIIVVWHQGESGTGDSLNMSQATKKVFDDITSAIANVDEKHPVDQVFFSRISNNQACSAEQTKERNQQFVELNETTDYVLVAPNALQYYFLDQFADEHHYDMNACNDFGYKIGSDIAQYYLNDRTKPNTTTYEETQNLGYGKLLNGLQITEDHLIAFDDTIDKDRMWLLAYSNYSAYAKFENVIIDYETDFELEFTLKLGDNLVGVSAGNTYPLLGSSDEKSSVNVGSDKIIIKSQNSTLTLAHNVSPMVYRPSSERICKEINHNTYKIVKQNNQITLYVNNSQISSQTVSESFYMNLDLFGINGQFYLQGIVSDFNFILK